MKPSYFPLFINMRQKKVRVYGAGKIAARRIGNLVRFGARVTVVAPYISEEARQLQHTAPEQVTVWQRAYLPGELSKEEADFVLAATDDKKVNSMIFKECRQKKIMINNASDRQECDFYFPALVERENLVIGVAGTDGDHKKTAIIAERLRQGNLV